MTYSFPWFFLARYRRWNQMPPSPSRPVQRKIPAVSHRLFPAKLAPAQVEVITEGIRARVERRRNRPRGRGLRPQT